MTYQGHLEYGNVLPNIKKKIKKQKGKPMLNYSFAVAQGHYKI